MITSGTMPRAPVPGSPSGRRREALLLAASMAIDAVATLILLAGAQGDPVVTVVVALSLHAGAVMLILASPVRPSRQWLSVSAAFFVPLVGFAVAMAAAMTTGHGQNLGRRRSRSHPRPAVALAEVHRLRDALPLWEAIASDDHDQQRSALMALSRRDDAEAIALLRRTAAAGADPDLALSAALALDEISERLERRMPPRNLWSVRDAVG